MLKALGFKLPIFAVSTTLSLFLPAALAQLVAAGPADAPSLSPKARESASASEPTPEDVGDALMIHQRYEGAINAYMKSVPYTPRIWNKMGIANQMMLNASAALHCYQESLKLDAHNASALNNLGTLYNSVRQYPQAERAYRKAVAEAPRDAVVLKNLGTVLLAEHKYEKGWDAYKAALALDPTIFLKRPSLSVENPGSTQDRGAMNYFMAKGCARAGMNDCAIDYLRRALNEGFTSPKKIASDREFAGLLGLPAFTELLATRDQR